VQVVQTMKDKKISIIIIIIIIVFVISYQGFPKGMLGKKSDIESA
jgi:hypothetical protein